MSRLLRKEFLECVRKEQLVVDWPGILQVSEEYLVGKARDDNRPPAVPGDTDDFRPDVAETEVERFGKRASEFLSRAHRVERAPRDERGVAVDVTGDFNREAAFVQRVSRPSR